MSGSSGNTQEPLLGSDTKEPAVGVPVNQQEDGSDTVWSGTTWQGFPGCMMCLSPLCCSNWQWDITHRRIDLTHGCCGGSMETIDLRRVTEIHFHRSMLQLCVNRGTITICSDHAEFPDLKLTTFGTKPIFEKLRSAWSQARIATAVGDHDVHHV
ncbi:g12978 [Coccomyxa viridis]|uniref:G12978 protein n=1 Tax=Coccomyxa viridis TaxID=1274662 RepID=A0ABP1GFT3_9CHLO